MAQDSPEDRELLSALRRVADEEGAEECAEADDSSEPVLARYRILRRLGEGGMGIVYEAEQRSPRRSVALKVLRPGAVSARTLRRFEYEAEILARLDHPGIAKVLESGSYDTGRGPQPWFAMERVDGQTLSEWVARQRPDRPQRLELFVAICEAVHHAHQKGIVHRDLKPANILVGAEGRPKVLDFGVARLAEAGSGTSTLRTLAGEVVGTLPYMSPEQVGAEPDVLDIRTDVYALGVVLYELLTGRRPLDLDGLSLTAAARAIESRAPQPLGALDPSLRGDLERIAATALSKDREQRYPSAQALADDVQRHLRFEPISARPPSGLYQLGRFARRNRLLFAALASVFVALVAGILATTTQVARARSAEDLAVAALGVARTDARRAQIAADFLQSVLEQANPQRRSADASMRDVLETAAQRVRRELAHEPLVEAEVRVSLGRAYLGLSEHELAREHLECGLALRERELGPRHHEVGTALWSLAEVENLAGEHARAEQHTRRALAIEQGAEAAHPRCLGLNLFELGRALDGQSRPEAAELALRDALAHFVEARGERCDDVASAKVKLAHVLVNTGRVVESEALLRSALEIYTENGGGRSTAAARVRSMLALHRMAQGALDEARALALEALDAQRERLGEEHPDLAIEIETLARIAWQGGDFARARDLFEESLDLQHATLGEGHYHTARTYLFLGRLFAQSGSALEAEAALSEVLAIYEDRPDRDGPAVIDALRELGALLARSQRDDEALDLLTEAREVALRALPPHHVKVLETRDAFGTLLLERHDYDEAERELRAALNGLVAHHPTAIAAMVDLRGKLQRLDEARAQFPAEGHAPEAQ